MGINKQNMPGIKIGGAAKVGGKGAGAGMFKGRLSRPKSSSGGVGFGYKRGGSNESSVVTDNRIRVLDVQKKKVADSTAKSKSALKPAPALAAGSATTAATTS